MSLGKEARRRPGAGSCRGKSSFKIEFAVGYGRLTQEGTRFLSRNDHDRHFSGRQRLEEGLLKPDGQSGVTAELGRGQSKDHQA